MRTSFQESIDNLLTAEDELHYIDPMSLESKEIVARNAALSDIADCINALVQKRLAALTDEGKRNLEQLRLATVALKDDLARVQNVSATLSVISSALNTIKSFLPLLT